MTLKSSHTSALHKIKALGLMNFKGHLQRPGHSYRTYNTNDGTFIEKDNQKCACMVRTLER